MCGWSLPVSSASIPGVPWQRAWRSGRTALSRRTSGISRPPFYRVDARRRLIEPQPPLNDADWTTIFSVMKEQGLTGIASAAITDSAMQRLSRLEFVTTINAGGARLLTDDGLQHLANMPQLQELDLSGWHSPLTDRGLEVLRHLENLQRFSMCWPQRITDAGIANLAHCRSPRAREPDGHADRRRGDSAPSEESPACGSSTPGSSSRMQGCRSSTTFQCSSGGMAAT